MDFDFHLQCNVIPRRNGIDHRPVYVEIVVEKWCWDRFLSAYFGFALPVSYRYCSIVIHLSIVDDKLNSVALVRTRTIPTERPPPVGEVIANFCR